MSPSRLAPVAAVLGLLAGTSAQAQQPHRSDSLAVERMATQGDCMAFMKDADHDLSRLMKEMHGAPQNRRTAAMMAVIDELATQSREMRAHMMGMMHGMGMSRMMSGDGPHGGGSMRKAPGPSAQPPGADEHRHQ